MWCHKIKPHRQCTCICKRLTLKKYTTTRSIAHIPIYNKHKHNHHYSHDISSSLELSQSMPKLISATGSYWNGRIPVAIWNFSKVLCTETVEATMPMSHRGFQARSKDQEILEEGGGAGLSKLDVFGFEFSKLFVNSGATDIVLVILSSTAVERAIAQCTSHWAMARGHRLNTSIVLVAVHGLSGLFRAVSAVEPFTLSSPSHSVPVPNRPSRLRGR